MRSVLAGGVAAQIRWGQHLRGRLVVQQPPVYQHQQVHRGGGGGGGGGNSIQASIEEL